MLPIRSGNRMDKELSRDNFLHSPIKKPGVNHHLNRLTEMVQMRGHSMHSEIWKLALYYSQNNTLSGALEKTQRCRDRLLCVATIAIESLSAQYLLKGIIFYDQLSRDSSLDRKVLIRGFEYLDPIFKVTGGLQMLKMETVFNKLTPLKREARTKMQSFSLRVLIFYTTTYTPLTFWHLVTEILEPTAVLEINFSVGSK